MLRLIFSPNLSLIKQNKAISLKRISALFKYGLQNPP